MYEIRFKGSRSKKDFKNHIAPLSNDLKEKIKNTLENNPYPSSSNGSVLNKVERRGKLYWYPLSGGDRILFDIIEIDQNTKVVLIHYSGDHDGEIRYLKKFTK